MKESPDKGWLPFLKMLFGYMLLVGLTGLALILALGKVEEKTSFGLHDVLQGLLIFSAQFAVWCFMEGKSKKPPPPNKGD